MTRSWARTLGTQYFPLWALRGRRILLCSYTQIHLVDLLPLVHLPSLREVETGMRLIRACSTIHDQNLLLLGQNLASRIFRHYDGVECAVYLLLCLLCRLLLVMRCQVG